MSLSPSSKSRKRVFVVGQIADLCLVSPRTVQEWIDGGLLRGHRLPESNERRVHRDDLISFLKQIGNRRALELLDGPQEDARSVIVVGAEKAWWREFEKQFADRADVALVYAAQAVEVGWQCGRKVPAAVVVDFAVSKADAVSLALWLTGKWPGLAVAGLVPEDYGPGAVQAVRGYGFGELWKKPAAAGAVAQWVGEQIRKESLK